MGCDAFSANSANLGSGISDSESKTVFHHLGISLYRQEKYDFNDDVSLTG